MSRELFALGKLGSFAGERATWILPVLFSLNSFSYGGSYVQYRGERWHFF